MKRLLFILSFISFSAFSQKPWRTLSFNNNFGVSAVRQPFNQFSANLYYEINPKVYVTNWTGINYTFHSNTSWLSSQALIMRKFDKLSIGGGLQYGAASQADFMFRDNSTYFIGSITYQIKL
jgi:hypothetical protein